MSTYPFHLKEMASPSRCWTSYQRDRMWWASTSWQDSKLYESFKEINSATMQRRYLLVSLGAAFVADSENSWLKLVSILTLTYFLDRLNHHISRMIISRVVKMHSLDRIFAQQASKYACKDFYIFFGNVLFLLFICSIVTKIYFKTRLTVSIPLFNSFPNFNSAYTHL